ncbi:MAG: hypothetical protein GY774_20165 [Planctomycetes bacterium]|nr:hypothetical protein [Planctomycetota bacterium]
MVRENGKSDLQNLPSCAVEFIKQVLKKMRYRRKIRQDVREELTAHFEDELKGCEADKDKEQKAKQLIAEFGDVKLLAVLLRRAKKRCRPLWRTAVVRSFQALGVIVLYFIICFVPLLVGSPTISVNYVDWLNELVQAGRDEADNARPYYEKAIELYVINPQNWLTDNTKVWSSDFNDVELNVMSRWLQDNRGALETLREGSRRPDFWNEYQNNEPKLNESLVENAMEILPGYRRLAFAMRLQIRYEVDNGDIEKSLSDCFALTKLGGHLQGNGLLIEQLVGIAIEAMAHGTTFKLLDSIDVSADILKNTYEQFYTQFNISKPVISMEAEKVFWYDQIQRAFTDDGNGSGRMLVQGLAYTVSDDWMNNLWRFVSFNHPDRQEVVANIDKYFESFAEVVAQTPLALSDKTLEDQLLTNDNVTPVMLKLQTPAHEKVSQIAWRMKSGRAALLTVLAVMRYEKEKGRYPASLDDLLKADYLKQLPVDPYSDGPLVYRKTESGFLLYSFGMNLKDDDGEMGLTKDGRPKMWMDNGDWVFWPVEKPQVKQ